MYCKLHDIEVYTIFIDKDVSGKSTDRPKYYEMINLVKENDIDMIIVDIAYEISFNEKEIYGVAVTLSSRYNQKKTLYAVCVLYLTGLMPFFICTNLFL